MKAKKKGRRRRRRSRRNMELKRNVEKRAIFLTHTHGTRRQHGKQKE